jgi:hypothetical protein
MVKLRGTTKPQRPKKIPKPQWLGRTQYHCDQEEN